ASRRLTPTTLRRRLSDRHAGSKQHGRQDDGDQSAQMHLMAPAVRSAVTDQRDDARTTLRTSIRSSRTSMSALGDTYSTRRRDTVDIRGHWRLRTTSYMGRSRRSRPAFSDRPSRPSAHRVGSWHLAGHLASCRLAALSAAERPAPTLLLEPLERPRPAPSLQVPTLAGTRAGRSF